MKTTASKLTLLDPHTGKTTDLPQSDGGAFSLTLRPSQSVFLVDDALLLDNGSPVDPADERRSYTIEMQAEVGQLSAGVCFSITDAGSYYMWQFNASDPQHPRLRPHRWLGGSVSLLGEVDLPSTVSIQTGHPFKVRLEIEDEAYIKTYIDDVLVDERSGSFAFGRIGFRQAHDDAYGKTEIAWFDDVSIRLKSGSVVFSEDFSVSNPFSAGSIVSGRLKVAGQMSHDVLAWLEEIPDGISEVKSETSKENNEATAYNLSGQRIVNRKFSRGIIISGRKKIVMN